MGHTAEAMLLCTLRYILFTTLSGLGLHPLGANIFLKDYQSTSLGGSCNSLNLTDVGNQQHSTILPQMSVDVSDTESDTEFDTESANMTKSTTANRTQLPQHSHVSNQA